MSRRSEISLTFRSLYSSPIVRVREYCCRACRSGPATEEHARSNDIVLLRHGAFCKHLGRHCATIDVNQAVFFSKESTYRISHPAETGDRGTEFILAPQVLTDTIREFDPSIEERPERPFPFVTGPCDPGVFWRHREFVQRLEARDADPLWADSTALQLISDVIEAAFARHGLPRQRRRESTVSHHANLCEAVKTFLASRLGERITLDNVAHAVHASPFHLARVFERRTGVPIHRYLTRLRLRASLERLAGGENDLTALALDLGFSSHSHFADAFRSEFGRTPSDVRRSAGRTIREMSKNLEV